MLSKSEVNMKKHRLLCCYLIVIIILVNLTGCDRYWEKKPYDYPNTIWKSEKPYLKIAIDKEYNRNCKLEIGNEIVDVDILFQGDWMVCKPSAKAVGNEYAQLYANRYFEAECEFSKEKCVANIVECNLESLKGVDKIILYNQDYTK